jgi:hypothetical protein
MTVHGCARQGDTDVTRRTRLTVLGCAALAAGLAPGTSEAKTSFGVNLNRPVDSNVSCALHPLPTFGTIPGGTSCTWYTYGQTFTISESTQVPAGNGTVTKVRIKEGSRPGPMKITVLRQQGFATSSSNIACCQAVAESQVFTPNANGITEIAVNLPVTNGVSLAGVPQVDYLAVTVLDTQTSVPLSYASTDNSYLGVTFYPGVSKGQERFDGGTTNYGYIALINADWEPAGSPGTSNTPTVPTTPKPGTPSVPGTTPVTPGGGAFAVTTPKVAKDGTIDLAVTIPSAGILRANANTSTKSKGAKPFKFIYGYSIKYQKQGGVIPIKIKATSLARSALKKGTNLKVTLAVGHDPTFGGEKASKTFTLTVKGTKPKKKK